jgi:UDP:flavonoid glycosyltransferase YjiC (YdhE family)
MAALEHYRAKIQQLGFDFHPIRPDWQPNDYELIRQCENLRTGPEVLFRKLVLPHLRGTYDDLRFAAGAADLMIAGELVFAAPLIAEKLGLRWVSAILSPCSFFSAHDPPAIPGGPNLHGFPWPLSRIYLDLAGIAYRHWWKPVRALRRDLGLRPTADPLFRDKFSGDLTLALFSRHFAKQQPDWPQPTFQPGFVFYDRQGAGAAQVPELAAFLESGEPPLVFTLGSTAVHNPGEFYEISARASLELGRRAVLLIGENPAPAPPSPDILVLPYAPYSELFPHAAVIVHQGGSGTTAQALRAGRPMLMVPYGWDQPDNGARVTRLGAGLTLPRSRYSVSAARTALDRFLTYPGYSTKASRLGAQIRAENGLTLGCDAIEAHL